MSQPPPIPREKKTLIYAAERCGVAKYSARAESKKDDRRNLRVPEALVAVRTGEPHCEKKKKEKALGKEKNVWSARVRKRDESRASPFRAVTCKTSSCGRARTAIDKISLGFSKRPDRPVRNAYRQTGYQDRRTVVAGGPTRVARDSTAISSCVVSANAYAPYQGRIVDWPVVVACPPAAAVP